MKGFELIRTLLENPYQELPAMTLMRIVPPPVEISRAEITATGSTVTGGFAGVESYDLKTKQELTDRRQRLKEDQEEARLRGDETSADKCQEEIEKIEDYLVLNSTHQGQARTIGADSEPARQAAWKQFTRALNMIEKPLPALAEHLRRHVKTGRGFVYRPASTDTIRWVTR